MIEIKFLDANGHYVDSTGFEAGIPDGIAKVEIDFGQENVRGQEMPNLTNLTSVTNMVNQTARKIDAITIQNVVQISPGFLALFVSLSNKTFGLRLYRCKFNELWSGCLMGSIMNGLTWLEIEDTHSWSLGARLIPSGYKILFEAVAASHSLERLEINDPVALRDQDCCSLVRALKRNQSLRYLRLDVNEITAPQEILRTALWETKLHELTVKIAPSVNYNHTGPRIPPRSNVPLSILIEGLFREGCTLAKLELSVFQYDIDVDFNAISVHNTSLVELNLSFANLTCCQLVKISKMCRSLQSLTIRGYFINDLASLDEILLGEAANLRFLYLDIRGVRMNKWIGFFEKIPKMKSIERLVITNDPFSVRSDEDSLRNTLLDALWQNTSLESCEIRNAFDPNHKSEIEVFFQRKVFFQKVPFFFCLNRTGRKALRNVPLEKPLQKALWPSVLERATKKEYYADDWKSQSYTPSTRTDAVYSLLREQNINIFA